MNGKKAKLLRYLTRFEPAAIRAYVTQDGKPWGIVPKRGRLQSLIESFGPPMHFGTAYVAGSRRAYLDAKRSFHRLG